GFELDARPAQNLAAGVVLLANLDVVIFLSIENFLEGGDRVLPRLVFDAIARDVDVLAVDRVFPQLDGAELRRLVAVLLLWGFLAPRAGEGWGEAGLDLNPNLPDRDPAKESRRPEAHH